MDSDQARGVAARLYSNYCNDPVYQAKIVDSMEPYNEMLDIPEIVSERDHLMVLHEIRRLMDWSNDLDGPLEY